MNCISCGKDIPVTAKICPFCHRDTKESSDVHGGMIMLGLVGAGIGYLFNGIIGAFIGSVLLGGVGGAILYIRAQARAGDKPAKVEVVGRADRSARAGARPEEQSRAAAFSPPPTQESVQAKRLATLEELRAKELVTAEEYAKKRQQILDDV